jgi:hypothetical protein
MRWASEVNPWLIFVLLAYTSVYKQRWCTPDRIYNEFLFLKRVILMVAWSCRNMWWIPGGCSSSRADGCPLLPRPRRSSSFAMVPLPLLIKLHHCSLLLPQFAIQPSQTFHINFNALVTSNSQIWAVLKEDKQFCVLIDHFIYIDPFCFASMCVHLLQGMEWNAVSSWKVLMPTWTFIILDAYLRSFPLLL